MLLSTRGWILRSPRQTMADDRSDDDLLDAFRKGRPEAFAVIVERWAPPLRAYARRMLSSPQAAEDVAMESFTRLARQAQHWDARGHLKAWLFTVARRLCLDELRERRRSDGDHGELIDLEYHRARPSPQAAAELGELARDLENALARLPSSHRDVLLLRVVHGLDSTECATVMGLAEDQVRSQLSYARKQLRRALTEHGVVGRKEARA